MTEGSPKNGSGRKSNHGSFTSPKGHVVLEGQKVEKQMNGRHSEGDEEEDQVRVRENSLNLVGILVCETKTLERN